MSDDTETTMPRLPRLMGIWAHPDDESFGMAGTIFRATQKGYPVAMVCATRGEEGKIADPALATPENLGQVRERELRAAMAAVNVSDVSFLDYIDGHLAEADQTEALGRVVYQIRRFQPDVVITFDANGGYGHVDHMAIHRLTVAGVVAAASSSEFPEQFADGIAPHRVRKLYYGAIPREAMLKMRDEIVKNGGKFEPGGDEATIPIEEMGVPMREITTFVKLTDDEFAAKRNAAMSHKTQLPADDPFAQMGAEQMRQVMGTETFQLQPAPLSEQDYPTPEQDVFAGLEQ